MYAPPIPVSTRRIFHTVKTGETLTSIAARHKVSVEDLKRWNGVSQAVGGQDAHGRGARRTDEGQGQIAAEGQTQEANNLGVARFHQAAGVVRLRPFSTCSSGPLSTILLSFITITRCAMARTTSMSCVTRM